MLHVFWCHFYGLRLRLWIWEVESCKKLIVALCWWSDHCHCVVILIIFIKPGCGLARTAGLRGPARYKVSLWVRAWAEGQTRGPLRHGTAGTRAKSARHVTARAWPSPMSIYNFDDVWTLSKYVPPNPSWAENTPNDFECHYLFLELLKCNIFCVRFQFTQTNSFHTSRYSIRFHTTNIISTESGFSSHIHQLHICIRFMRASAFRFTHASK